jgi:hypothetical protein
MSAKDFEAIAAIIRGDFACARPNEKGAIWCLTLSLADYFAATNPRFDRSRFYAAALGDSDHFKVRADFHTANLVTPRDPS